MSKIRSLLARGAKRFIGPWVSSRNSLAFNYRIAQLAGCEPELTFLHRLGPNRGVAIDAGANEGLFSYRLARLYQHVHAFEINPVLAEPLRRLVPANVTVHAVGLSSAESTSILFTPFFRDYALTGWASLDPANCPHAERCVQSSVIVRPLDAFGFDNITFLKADIEGHEMDMLSGARETLRRNRPVVLLEIKTKNLDVVNKFFCDFGYTQRRLEQLIGVAGSVENYVFLPGQGRYS